MAKKTEVPESEVQLDRRPSEQALEVVDRAVGTVRSAVEVWSTPATRERGAGVRRQVTDRVVDEARKARRRVEPTYKQRVEPVYKQRVEPVVRERVEPLYRERVEPGVRKVLARV